MNKVPPRPCPSFTLAEPPSPVPLSRAVSSWLSSGHTCDLRLQHLQSATLAAKGLQSCSSPATSCCRIVQASSAAGGHRTHFNHPALRSGQAQPHVPTCSSPLSSVHSVPFQVWGVPGHPLRPGPPEGNKNQKMQAPVRVQRNVPHGASPSNLVMGSKQKRKHSSKCQFAFSIFPLLVSD